MGLPEKFDKRLKDNLGLRAVWLPGTEIGLGDVLQHKHGIFQPIANLSDFGVRFRSRKLGGKMSLKFQARGVSSTVLQAGIAVDPTQIDARVDAELKIEFKNKNTYFIRTPQLIGDGINNLMEVGKAIKGLPVLEWKHKEYFIAWRVYRAKEFVFLGSQSSNRTVRLRGLGSGILDFLTLGASANVARVTEGSVTIEMIGEGGPVAMSTARIKKDGQIY